MKKLMICLLIMAAFIGFAIYGSLWIMGVNRKASEEVKKAITACEEGDMQEAEALLLRCYEDWRQDLDIQGALIHHEGLDFAEESFTMVLREVKENREAFLVEASRLTVLLDNLAYADIPGFGNLF